MQRLQFCLRLFAVAVAFPAILLYIALATLIDMATFVTGQVGEATTALDGGCRLDQRNPCGLQLLGAV